MISPYKFSPRARLLDFMRQAGDPKLINLAAGLPSADCVPKAALKRAFDEALSEEPDVALGYHTPDGDYSLREMIAKRFARRGILVGADEMVITTGCTQALHGMIKLLAAPVTSSPAKRPPITRHWKSSGTWEFAFCLSRYVILRASTSTWFQLCSNGSAQSFLSSVQHSRTRPVPRCPMKRGALWSKSAERQRPGFWRMRSTESFRKLADFGPFDRMTMEAASHMS